VIPLTVTAERFEGFDGPINIKLERLPAGITATTNTIAAGQTSCTILVSASDDVVLADAHPFQISGTAQIAKGAVTHRVDPEEKLMLIAVALKPDIVLHAATEVVEIEPGQTAEVRVRVARQNGFAGRVPIEVRDLPDRVRVTDSGLNGVLVTEDESERSFKIWALPNAAPVEGRFYVSGRVETRSGQQNSYAAPEAIVVRVKSPQRRAE
jgi:hypothetical protein